MEMYTGVLTALVTPMRGGKVDVGALEELVCWQIESGVDGLVPCGTTGEAATLSQEERGLVIRTVADAALGRVPVVAGAGANSTAGTIDLCKAAVDAGANGLLLVCPYYNKPTQPGLEAHFRAVLDTVDVPVVLYNIPGRTGVDMGVDTFVRLAQDDRVVGIKEATGSVVRAAELVHNLAGKAAVLAGDDPLYLPVLAVGGLGIISASACVAPKEMVAVARAFQDGQQDQARKQYFDLLGLFSALFSETNPGPAKAALHLMGRVHDEIRLPLVWPGPASLEAVRREMTMRGML